MALVDQIDEALADGPVSYIDLARKLFTDPKSWRYAVQGGPPGCYMVLSAALRRGGFTLQMLDRKRSNASRLVYPRSKTR